MPQDHESARLLLESQHTFPGPFTFRLVIRPEVQTAVVSAMGALATTSGEVVTRPSRNGKFLSLHVPMTMRSADHVLEMWDLLKQLDGVLMTL